MEISWERVDAKSEVLKEINLLLHDALAQSWTLREFGDAYVRRICQPHLAALTSTVQSSIHDALARPLEPHA